MNFPYFLSGPSCLPLSMFTGSQLNDTASRLPPVSSANVNKSKDGSSSIFDEIQHDSIDQEKPASKRRNTAQNQHSAANHNHMRSNDENKKPSLAPPSGLGIQ
ncbi:hypothetical protein YC2023_075033 [Brassica napus]